MGCPHPPCIHPNSEGTDIPYVRTQSPSHFENTVLRTPSLGTPGLLETTIELFPSSASSLATAAEQIFSIEEENLRTIGEFRRHLFVNAPPSHAVDGHLETAFCSPESRKILIAVRFLMTF